MPTILVINDDGIHSIGLITLRKQLKNVDIISINVPEKADSKRMKITSLSYKGTELST